MARTIHVRDITGLLAAAKHWIDLCLIDDGSLFENNSLWTTKNVEKVRAAFVDHPDDSDADFMTKLMGQMGPASVEAQKLAAEMLWALLLFPSNMKARTKRWQIQEVWALSGQELGDDAPYLSDTVLQGVGSGGPAFNNYRPRELEFLISLSSDLKSRSKEDRTAIFADYKNFMTWMTSVRPMGNRQFRHMLRYFAFPDRVERISSNNDRRSILEAFDVAPMRETKDWSDEQLDDALLLLRARLNVPNLDFYEPSLKTRWQPSYEIKSPGGQVPVVVPSDDDDDLNVDHPSGEARQSFQIQAKLVEIGAAMRFKVWVPKPDRARVSALISDTAKTALLEELPLSYDRIALDTIKMIDVIWTNGRSIARAFEVEHTTAVYSGLLRMADLLALVPNMDIRFDIVAPDERREKVFHEMLRPVFALLDGGPLSKRCAFISYDNVNALHGLEHLSYVSHSILQEYEDEAVDIE